MSEHYQKLGLEVFVPCKLGMSTLRENERGSSDSKLDALSALVVRSSAYGTYLTSSDSVLQSYAATPGKMARGKPDRQPVRVA
jgi:hypothetical protein